MGLFANWLVAAREQRPEAPWRRQPHPTQRGNVRAMGPCEGRGLLSHSDVSQAIPGAGRRGGTRTGRGGGRRKRARQRDAGPQRAAALPAVAKARAAQALLVDRASARRAGPATDANACLTNCPCARSRSSVVVTFIMFVWCTWTWHKRRQTILRNVRRTHIFFFLPSASFIISFVM
jgi:hypothetical protein